MEYVIVAAVLGLLGYVIFRKLDKANGSGSPTKKVNEGSQQKK